MFTIYIVFFGLKKTSQGIYIWFILIILYEKNGRLLRAVGAGSQGMGVMAYQILANQLALSQQGGGRG